MNQPKQAAQTIEQLLKQSISAENLLGSGENCTSFALTGFGEDQADHRFVVRIPNNILPVDFPIHYPYPRVGNVDAILASHTMLTPMQHIFTQGNVGQALIAVADQKKMSPIRIHLRQEGVSLANRIEQRRQFHESSLPADVPERTTQADALAKIDVMKLLMERPHTLPALAERTAQLGAQGVKFLDPHTGNILLDDRGMPGFVDVVCTGKEVTDRGSLATKASIYLEQLRKDLLEDFSPQAALKDETIRAQYCATKRQFETALDQAISDMAPLVADSRSRLYQPMPVFAKSHSVTAVSLADPPRALLEQLNQLAAQVQSAAR